MSFYGEGGDNYSWEEDKAWATPQSALPQPYYDPQQYSYDVAPTPQYVPPEYGPPPPTPWYQQAGEGISKYAQNNPRDVLGMAAGVGLGAWGLLRGNENIPQPDLTNANNANAALSQYMRQMSTSGQPLNAAAIARMQEILGGNYGDYNDAARLRQEANAKIQALINSPTQMLPEDQARLTQLDQEYSAKNMLGSSLHMQAKAALQREIQNNMDTRRNAQIQSLQGVSNAQNSAQSGVFQNTNASVGTNNQANNSTIQGLSGLYKLGLDQANESNASNVANAQLKNARSTALLNTGGNIFGRAIAPTYRLF